MDVSEILEGLNAEQREAVSHHERIVRVIAGAGSGKTRVLVQRMLWLMKVEGLPAQALLALTFTNKAAREMQQRLEVGVQSRLPDLWMGAFHGICYRILRRHAEKMGWIKDFVVMDSEDQLSFIRRLMRDNLWSDDTISAQDLRNYINKQKEQGLRANAVIVKSAQAVVMRDFYQQYEYRSKEQGRMDFAELQLLTVELLQSHDNVRESFRRRFEAILVDEFQDTNGLQMQLARRARGKHAGIGTTFSAESGNSAFGAELPFYPNHFGSGKCPDCGKYAASGQTIVERGQCRRKNCRLSRL